MKDLQIASNGDLVLSGGDIPYISGANLEVQKTRLVLGTNKGEWVLNPDEGINFNVMLGKNPNYDQIIDTVLDGLHQINEDIQISSYRFEKKDRHLVLKFTASLPNGQEVTYTVGEIPSTGSDDSWLIRALADLVEVKC